MTRTDIERFIGWTLVAVSGDLINPNDPDDVPSRLRLCFKNPETGALVDLHVEAHDDDPIGLQFSATDRECLQYAKSHDLPARPPGDDAIVIAEGVTTIERVEEDARRRAASRRLTRLLGRRT